MGDCGWSLRVVKGPGMVVSGDGWVWVGVKRAGDCVRWWKGRDLCGLVWMTVD